MEKIEKREVKVKICDFCGGEVSILERCVICRREMCNAGTGKHTSHSLEIYSFNLDDKRYSIRVCKECADKKTGLTIGQLFDGMLGDSPVPTIGNTTINSLAPTTGDVLQAQAAHFGVDAIHLSKANIENDVISSVPSDIARKYRVIPVFRIDCKIGLAIADPSDLDTLDSLMHLLNAEIEPRVASEQDITAALQKYYPLGGGEAIK